MPLQEGDQQRWSVYNFTTPLGDVEITAHSISDELLKRLAYAAGAIVIILLLGWFVRRGVRQGYTWCVQSSATTAMILLGLVAIFLGVLPMLGVIAVLAGIALKIGASRKKAAVAN